MPATIGRVAHYYPAEPGPGGAPAGPLLAFVGAVSEGATGQELCTLMVCAPPHPPYWVEGVPEGVGPGTWRFPPRA